MCEREGVRENNKRANFKKSKKNNTAISYGDYGQRRKKKKSKNKLGENYKISDQRVIYLFVTTTRHT